MLSLEEIKFYFGWSSSWNQKMIEKVGKFLKSINICGMRGGAFKPLTFPYRSKKYFETKLNGLKWLKQTKDKRIDCYN